MTPKQLMAFRGKLGLTRRQLAELLEVDPHHVYMLESGKRGITRILTLAVLHLECHLRNNSGQKPIQKLKSESKS